MNNELLNGSQVFKEHASHVSLVIGNFLHVENVLEHFVLQRLHQFPPYAVVAHKLVKVFPVYILTVVYNCSEYWL